MKKLLLIIVLASLCIGCKDKWHPEATATDTRWAYSGDSAFLSVELKFADGHREGYNITRMDHLVDAYKEDYFKPYGAKKFMDTTVIIDSSWRVITWGGKKNDTLWRYRITAKPVKAKALRGNHVDISNNKGAIYIDQVNTLNQN